MKIYLDLVFFLNFSFDLLLLLTLKIILKRNTSFKRIVLGSLIGSLSIFFLFIKINSLELFLFKVLVSIFMILITFGYKNKKYFFKNFLYLYFVSIILGGFLYFLNITFSYKNNGLVFIYKGLSINFILLIIISPIILYFYIKQIKSLKIINNYYYQVSFKYKNKTYNYNAYLDTGNSLYSYSKIPVILLYDKSFTINNPIYIPYSTVDNTSLLKAFKINKIIINNNPINKKIIIALINKPFNIDNINMLLHKDFI